MKVGSLFSGYGGLDLAVGGDLAWYSEIEPAACKVMEAHYPGVPNIGDVTKVDWAEVEPVDVITGGYPCQPFSNAGMRKGTQDERHLWPYVRDALGAIRPAAAVLENVRGHLTLGFDVVLADLADLGWSARWGVVRAADAGAPHNRARLFIVAHPAGNQRNGRPVGHDPKHERAARILQVSSRGNSGDVAYPQGAERGATQPDHLQARGATEPRERPSTPANTQVSSRRCRSGQEASKRKEGGSQFAWGNYAPAINRWQSVIGRPAPSPTIQRNERDRLNPEFVEWMMGLPEGWVTGHGFSASQELKMLGNGVVPQQARLALELLGGVA